MSRLGETPEERIERLKESGGWIGVDFDGTLAEYHGWDEGKVGAVIPKMADRIRAWRKAGIEVRIFTARVSGGDERPQQVIRQRSIINKFLLGEFGETLPITNEKDYKMIELWDDRAVQVIENTGVRADGRDF